MLRNRERFLLKYKLELNWTAFKVERNIYNRLLRYKKHQVISKKVNDLKGDTKSLYRLNSNLTDNDSVNPMPPGKSDEQLVNEFAEFFLTKIDKIRSQFNGVPA